MPMNYSPWTSSRRTLTCALPIHPVPYLTLRPHSPSRRLVADELSHDLSCTTRNFLSHTFRRYGGPSIAQNADTSFLERQHFAREYFRRTRRAEFATLENRSHRRWYSNTSRQHTGAATAVALPDIEESDKVLTWAYADTNSRDTSANEVDTGRRANAKGEAEQLESASGQKGYAVMQQDLHNLVQDYGFDNSGTAPEDLPGLAGHGSPNSALSSDANIGRAQMGRAKAMRYFSKLLEDNDVEHAELMRAYEDLPAPRMAQLSEGERSALLSILCRLPHKDQASSLRFFRIMTDMKSAKLTPPVEYWTTAMHFAGRCVKALGNEQFQAALSLWKEMEAEAGIKADTVTFNVLIDVATKARKLMLAEMLQKEMLDRGLLPDRYSRFSLINFYGVKGDGTGVRKAYHDFVAAGEYVDSAVIGCMISALLACSEPGAAEQIFERAKRMDAQNRLGAGPPKTWQARRDISRLLQQKRRAPRDGSNNGDGPASTSPKVLASVAPGESSYRALIKYYAVVAGDLDRVTSLLDEVESSGLLGRGSIFLDLFKGFTIYGGMLYSEWTQQKLERMWTAFVTAVQGGEEHEDKVYFTHSMASLCIGAFARCAGTPKMYDIWEEIQTMWTPTDDERASIEDQLELHAARNRSGTELPYGRRKQGTHFYLR